MQTIDELLECNWGSEKWIDEGWQHINDDERALIISRMDHLFKDGLPFETKGDKLPYIYCFSLLAQIEAIGIQVPLKFESQVEDPIFKKNLRTQLLDEIFHGLAFTKIVYMLSSPQAHPPAFNEHVESLCNFIRNEPCPKVGLIMLNLVVEGWGEELFSAIRQQGIATNVLDLIIADERRHVHEADLYRQMGLPDKEIIQAKLATLEELFMSAILFQYQYMASLSLLLGPTGSLQLLGSLNQKYTAQLKKINLQPTDHWFSMMRIVGIMAPQQMKHITASQVIPMTPMRKVLMTQWDNPDDPTMVGEFNLNISCLDFFNKAYPPEMLTTLTLQAISLGLSETPSFRTFLQHGELRMAEHAYTSIAVKLPGCGDHISAIAFEDCHLLPVNQLAEKIRNIIKIMVFLYKKREQLEQEHPHLKHLTDTLVDEMAYGTHAYPLLGNPAVSVSNIGHCGYSRSKSPLFKNESMKFVLLEVDRKMVWNKTTHQFEAQDILPVSISADHRIFDGNIPVPKIMSKCFERVFEKMLHEREYANKIRDSIDGAKSNVYNHGFDMGAIQIIEGILKTNLELGYKLLYFYQTIWADYMSFDAFMSTQQIKENVY